MCDGDRDKFPSQGWADLFCGGPGGTYLRLCGHTVSTERLGSAAVVQRQPYILCKRMEVAVCQSNLIRGTEIGISYVSFHVS